MKFFRNKFIFSLLTLALIFTFTVPALGSTTNEELNKAVEDTAEYMYNTVKAPQVGSIGGEWAIIGLARSGYNVPEEYYQDYYARVEKYVEDCKGNLHDKKYTEYSRLIVALTSIGKDARNVAGYDLTKALGDYDKTIWQGMNGPIWALIALDSGNYPMPKNPDAETQATRQMYIDRILDCQLPDGGWSLFGGTSSAGKNEKSDPDITGMALQALAKYQDQEKVKKATEEALDCMSKQQDNQGGFSSWGAVSSESTVQMLVALNELGISINDPRFVKNGNNPLDNLMTFYLPKQGFVHTQSGSGNNQMSSEQGFYGLVSAKRALDGKSSLYRMNDAIHIGEAEKTEGGFGLEGKDKNIKFMPVVKQGVTFPDIVFSKNISAIEALASRNIINGMDNGNFEPESTMTRAEFATIVVKALGLEPKENNKFNDVKSGQWYSGFIGTASDFGIVNGVGDNKYNPNGTITRQEAGLMVSRAAEKCGLDTKLDKAAVRDILAGFNDYVKVASWAQDGLAFCYNSGILDNSSLEILPNKEILRCEIAQMIYNLLAISKLL